MEYLNNDSKVVVYTEQVSSERRKYITDFFAPAKVLILPIGSNIAVFQDDNATQKSNFVPECGVEVVESEVGGIPYVPVNLNEPPLRVDSSFLDEFAGEPILTTFGLCDYDYWQELKKAQQEEFDSYFDDKNQIKYEIIYELPNDVVSTVQFMEEKVILVDGVNYTATEVRLDGDVDIWEYVLEMSYIHTIAKIDNGYIVTGV